jgi:hypothetical protein
VVEELEDALGLVLRQGVVDGGGQIEEHESRAEDARPHDVRRVAPADGRRDENRQGAEGQHEPDAVGDAVDDLFPERLRARTVCCWFVRHI